MPTSFLRSLSVFACGCIGAIAPEIIRLYKLRQQKERIEFPRSYFLFIIPFIVLGGFVALILDSSPMWSAFLEGAAVQFTVSAVAGSDMGKARKLSEEDIERIGEKVREVITSLANRSVRPS